MASLFFVGQNQSKALEKILVDKLAPWLSSWFNTTTEVVTCKFFDGSCFSPVKDTEGFVVKQKNEDSWGAYRGDVPLLLTRILKLPSNFQTSTLIASLAKDAMQALFTVFDLNDELTLSERNLACNWSAAISLSIQNQVIEIVLSASVIEQLLSLGRPKTNVKPVAPNITAELAQQTITGKVSLSCSPISVADFIKLSEGDVLRCQSSLDSPVTLQLDHMSLNLHGHLAKKDGSKAIYLTHEEVVK